MPTAQPANKAGAPRSRLAWAAAVVAAVLLPAAVPGAAQEPAPPAATALATAKDTTAGKPKGAAQSIAVLINDEPITAYEIEQRASFLALSSGGGGGSQKVTDEVERRWKNVVKDPKTNERFKAELEKHKVNSKEEAQAVQTQFVKRLQQDLVAQVQREMRSGAVAGSRKSAIEELIDEKLKMQEAKRLGALADDAEVDKFVGGIAERNKMTIPQFGQHMKGMGVDISTMRARFKAEISWREVVRRRFGHMIAITDRDVDRLVASAPAAVSDDVELQVQRIVLAVPGKGDQKALAQRIAEADAMASQFSGCAAMQGLANIPGAKFENLGSRRPSTIPDPTRSLLLNARDGDLLPPSVSAGGVELWAVCGRTVVKADDTKRENAQNELRQREFEILAKKHLKDLRQDAAIEYR